MKIKFLFPVVLFAGLMFVNFSIGQVNGQAPQDKVIKLKASKYTCPMHPEVVQDMPGKCPKCGGQLVEKREMPLEPAPMPQEKDSTMKKEHKMIDTTTTKHDPLK